MAPAPAPTLDSTVCSCRRCCFCCCFQMQIGIKLSAVCRFVTYYILPNLQVPLSPSSPPPYLISPAARCAIRSAPSNGMWVKLSLHWALHAVDRHKYTLYSRKCKLKSAACCKLENPRFVTLIGYITAPTKRKKRFMQTQVTHKNFRAKGTKRLLTYLAYSQCWPGPIEPGPGLGDSLGSLSKNCVQVLFGKEWGR